MNHTLLKIRKQDISIMRIIATIAVIFLHTCNTISNNSDKYVLSDNQRVYFSLGVYLMNWSVPVFLMITGALLLNKEKVISYKDCIAKYTKRIVFALFIFGIPFSMIESIFNKKQINIKIFIKAISDVCTGNSWSHLWYLYSLIGIYLVIPLLKTFVDKVERKDVRVILVVLFLFNFILPVFKSLFSVDIAFEIPIQSYTVFYVLLGEYLYGEKQILVQYKKMCLGILIVLCVFVGLINKYYFLYSGILLGYNSPLIAVIAALIFLLLKGCSIKNINHLWKLDRLCFGVYLIHPVFINFTYKFTKITPLSVGKLYPFAIVLFWIFFVICSFITSWFMYNIKPLKKYVL